MRDVRDLGGQASGTVRICANMSAVIGFLPERIRAFANEYPLVQVMLAEQDTGDVMRACLDDRADVGIGVTMQAPPGLETWHFADDPLMVVLGQDHVLPAALDERRPPGNM